MCGDLEEDGPSGVEERLHARFVGHARNLLAQYAKAPQPKDDNDLNAYMNKLFTDALSRAARDSDSVHDGQHYARLAAQPLVFARLAGFLASHMALQEDPLRKVLEAIMLGYAEGEEMTVADHEHGHSHDNDHDHDHDHGHSHGHGHGDHHH
jgi:hypothetical protein